MFAPITAIKEIAGGWADDNEKDFFRRWEVVAVR
jgi:hypothetical protein